MQCMQSARRDPLHLSAESLSPGEMEFMFGGSEAGAQDCNHQPTAAWAVEGLTLGPWWGRRAFAAHFGKDTKTSGTEVRAEPQGQPLSEGQLCSVQGGRRCIWASLPFVHYEGEKEGRL